MTKMHALLQITRFNQYGKYILAILALTLVVLLFYDLIRQAFRNKTFFRSQLFKYVLTISAVIILPWLAVKYFATEPDLDSNKKALEFAQKYDVPLMAAQVCFSELSGDSLNSDLHFKAFLAVRKHLNQSYTTDADITAYARSGFASYVKNVYQNYQASSDTLIRDVGLLFHSLHEMLIGNTYLHFKLYNITYPDSLEYYSYVMGSYYRQKPGLEYDSAHYYLTRSIEQSEAVEQSTEELCKLYYYYGHLDSLEELVADPELGSYVPDFSKRIVYLENLNIIGYTGVVLNSKYKVTGWIGLIVSLALTLAWLFYLRSVDIYEPEKWRYIILTFGLACVCIFLVYPLNDVLWHYTTFQHTLLFRFEFVREFIQIGLFEELAKIIPVLIVLATTRAINEPYDYIFYSALSGLGFGFIENLTYLADGSLYNINGRMLYSLVGHMAFTSTIGYGLMLARYRYRTVTSAIFLFCVTFLGAALFHTFYDFWLIDEWASQYSFITTIFLLILIHAWFVMKNNALNISNFYSADIVIRNDRIKFYLLITTLVIFMMSYMINSFTRGPEWGDNFLATNAGEYGYFIFYLTLSFSRYEIIRGFLAPFNVPYKFLIPRLRPRKKIGELSVRLHTIKGISLVPEFEFLRRRFPTNGVITKRVVVSDQLNSYTIQLESELEISGFNTEMLLLKPKSRRAELDHPGKVMVYLLAIPESTDLSAADLTLADFTMIGWGMVVKIT